MTSHIPRNAAIEISRGARFNSPSVDLVKVRGRLGEAVANFPFPAIRGGQLTHADVDPVKILLRE